MLVHWLSDDRTLTSIQSLTQTKYILPFVWIPIECDLIFGFNTLFILNSHSKYKNKFLVFVQNGVNKYEGERDQSSALDWRHLGFTLWAEKMCFICEKKCTFLFCSRKCVNKLNHFAHYRPQKVWVRSHNFIPFIKRFNFVLLHDITQQKVEW